MKLPRYKQGVLNPPTRTFTPRESQAEEAALVRGLGRSAGQVVDTFAKIKQKKQELIDIEEANQIFVNLRKELDVKEPDLGRQGLVGDEYRDAWVQLYGDVKGRHLEGASNNVARLLTPKLADLEIRRHSVAVSEGNAALDTALKAGDKLRQDDLMDRVADPLEHLNTPELMTELAAHTAHLKERGEFGVYTEEQVTDMTMGLADAFATTYLGTRLRDDPQSVLTGIANGEFIVEDEEGEPVNLVDMLSPSANEKLFKGAFTQIGTLRTRRAAAQEQKDEAFALTFKGRGEVALLEGDIGELDAIYAEAVEEWDRLGTQAVSTTKYMRTMRDIAKGNVADVQASPEDLVALARNIGDIRNGTLDEDVFISDILPTVAVGNQAGSWATRALDAGRLHTQERKNEVREIANVAVTTFIAPLEGKVNKIFRFMDSAGSPISDRQFEVEFLETAIRQHALNTPGISQAELNEFASQRTAEFVGRFDIYHATIESGIKALPLIEDPEGNTRRPSDRADIKMLLITDRIEEAEATRAMFLIEAQEAIQSFAPDKKLKEATQRQRKRLIEAPEGVLNPPGGRLP